MAGILSPQHGKVFIDGMERKSTVEQELAIRQRTVFLPDKPWLPKNRTGRKFLIGVGQIYRIPDDQLLDHVDPLLSHDHPQRWYVHTLQLSLGPLGTTCGLLALLLIGPRRDRWRLNGKHRIVPGYPVRKAFESDITEI